MSSLPALVHLFCLLTWAMVAVLFERCAADEYRHEQIPLWPAGAPGSEGARLTEKYVVRPDGIGWMTGVSQPTLTIYTPPEEKRSGVGVIICPGGGYAGLAVDHEGHTLAKWFAERGIFAAVLKYRHGSPFKHPIPLGDAQRALRLVRSRAEEWQLQPDQIGIAGFSAGGHLASTAGTRFDEGDSTADDPVERVSCRANFLVLAYPVISMDTAITHRGSRRLLLPPEPSGELVTLLSAERQVTAETPPAFITHAADDSAVPVENALRFYEALCKSKVSAELHVYATGGHGYGMFRRDQPADRWPDLLEGWLLRQKLMK